MGLTQEMLKEVIHYNPDTGVFVNAVNRSASARKGKRTGYKNPSGYLSIRINGKLYQAHRLAFLYMTGEWPNEVDHVNHIRSDNRWSNLRSVTRQENKRNESMKSTNTSGFTGVSFFKSKRRWRAHVVIGGVQKHLGYFDTIEQAIDARKTANAKHKFHANHGAVAKAFV